MVEWIEKQRNMQMSRWNDYDKFDKMILNQQIRFTYKSLKRYIIEKHVKYLKHWDLTSTVVLRDEPKVNLSQNKAEKAYGELVKGETDSLKYFMKQVDNETAVNVLFACSKGEFSKIMGKFDLTKREILEKCHSLLADNMREYNFMDQYSRDYGYHQSDHYGSKSRDYDNRSRFSYSSRNYNSYDKRSSYYNDKYSYSNYDTEKPVYSGRFKNMFHDTANSPPENREKKTTEINEAISIIEKPKSPSPDHRRHSYKDSSYYSHSREKYDRRSTRHYMRSDERDRDRYKDYRRSSHRSTRRRRSSSRRRSTSRSHHRSRRY